MYEISNFIIPNQVTLIIDTDLYIHDLSKLIRSNRDITCVLFKTSNANLSASMVKNYENGLLTAYEGDNLEEIELKNFNYIKLQDKLYNVEMTKEINVDGNPVYDLTEI